MRGFTLIELMIVIAIIAIIASIAIPNVLESRITANESAAAMSLKSALHPAMTQFQNGAYSDVDGDGRGEYASDHQYLAGVTGPAAVGVSVRSVMLLPSPFAVADRTPVGAYRFQIDTDVSGGGSYTNAETCFGAYAAPATSGDGRRSFAIHPSGTVFASKQTYPASLLFDLDALSGGVHADNTGTFSPSNSLLASDPRMLIGPHNPDNAVPFQK